MAENTDNSVDLATKKNVQREDIDNLMVASRYLARQLADNIEFAKTYTKQGQEIDKEVIDNFYRADDNVLKTAWHAIARKNKEEAEGPTTIKEINLSIYRQFKLSFGTLFSATRNNISEEQWADDTLKEELDEFFDVSKQKEITPGHVSDVLKLWNRFHETMHNCGLANIQYQKVSGKEAYINPYYEQL